MMPSQPLRQDWLMFDIVVCVFIGLHLSRLVSGAIPSYCQWETFNATCSDGHVIMMKSAEYGRMRTGRCVSTDYYTGCQANVLDHVDERCSGRQSCVIEIPDPKLFNVQPCRKDLVAYFEAEYDCIPVANPLLDKTKKTYCRGPIDLSSKPSGYIGSSVTAETELGSRNCPWLIKAHTGQRINVTMYDFSVRSSPETPSKTAKVKGMASKSCPMHASLREGKSLYSVSQQTVSVGVCAAEARRRLLYTTKSNSLIVEMINVSHINSQSINFVLKYEVVGCADLKNPTNARMERKGDSLMISCNSSQETWHLVCKGTTWIGDYHNCSSALNKMAVGDDTGREEQGFPLGLLVAIAIGVVVGVVLGFVFLIGIFICRRRSRQELKHDSGNPLMGGSGIDPDQQNIYRLVEVRPPPPPLMCECHIGSDPKGISTLENKITLGTPPGECIYRTSPRFEHSEFPYSPPEIDNMQNQITQHQINPCDIINDIHRTDGGVHCCANGQDCYSSNPCVLSPSDTYPRIKPFPTFRGERGTNPRVPQPPQPPQPPHGEAENSPERFESTIYESRQ